MNGEKMDITLLKGCVIGTGKTGAKDSVVNVEDDIGRGLIVSGAARKATDAEVKAADKDALAAAKAAEKAAAKPAAKPAAKAAS